MTININSESVKTTDLALAAALSTRFPISSIDKSNSLKAVFVFECTKDLEDTIQSYWNGQMVVEPRSYYEHLRILKTRIYGVV